MDRPRFQEEEVQAASLTSTVLGGVVPVFDNWINGELTDFTVSVAHGVSIAQAAVGPSNYVPPLAIEIAASVDLAIHAFELGYMVARYAEFPQPDYQDLVDLNLSNASSVAFFAGNPYNGGAYFTSPHPASINYWGMPSPSGFSVMDLIFNLILPIQTSLPHMYCSMTVTPHGTTPPTCTSPHH